MIRYFVVFQYLKIFTVYLCLSPSFLFASLTGISGELRKFCAEEYCIFLKEGEIKAEAGLCAIIPCSFRIGSGFKPTNIIWYKCELAQKRCSASDVVISVDFGVVIHTEINRIQSGFKRVSLFDPNLNRENCSIIINDLTASDSGSYELRVNGLLNGKTDGYTFLERANVSVKGMKSYYTYINIYIQ